MSVRRRKPWKTLEILTWEFLLTRLGWSNGAEVIVIRSGWMALFAYGIFYLVTRLIPGGAGGAGPGDFLHSMGRDAEKLGLLFGAFYAAFYTRFSSQWTYLANLYKEIMRTLSSMSSEPTERSRLSMVEWKAGFVADAFALHLANKRTIAHVIRSWLEDPEVAEAYFRFTPYADHYLGLIGTSVEQVRGWHRAERQAAARGPEETAAGPQGEAGPMRIESKH